MAEWIPTRASAKGRLVLAALTSFAAADDNDVGVSELCATAEVTTGALYHYFNNKLGLYDIARSDIERRVLDRLHGAAAALTGGAPGAVAHAALLVAFDFLVAQILARFLAHPHPARQRDPAEIYIARVADQHGAPTGRVLVAAWRAALGTVIEGVRPARARAAFAAVHVQEPQRRP